jgi:class 3 adenylate cyclase
MRLAAVLSADMVGYSRLMGLDEAGTLSRLNALRRELIDPAIATHLGSIVKLMGDGALVEFSSAVDAERAPSKSRDSFGSTTPVVPAKHPSFGRTIANVDPDPEPDAIGFGANSIRRQDGNSRDRTRHVRIEAPIASDSLQSGSKCPSVPINRPRSTANSRLSSQITPKMASLNSRPTTPCRFVAAAER